VCCQEGHALVRQRGDEGEAWTCDMLDYSTGCRYYEHDQDTLLERFRNLLLIEIVVRSL